MSQKDIVLFIYNHIKEELATEILNLASVNLYTLFKFRLRSENVIQLTVHDIIAEVKVTTPVKAELSTVGSVLSEGKPVATDKSLCKLCILHVDHVICLVLCDTAFSWWCLVCNTFFLVILICKIHRGYLFFSVKDRNLFHRVDTIGNIFTSGTATRENITGGVHEMK